MKTLYQTIDEYCKKEQISGSLRITLQGKIIHQQFMGYADYENRVTFNEKSVFSLYSLSKPFCAIGLMKLADKGLIDIDRHPGQYLSEMESFDPRVTIRHMLQHISGLPDFKQTKEFADKYQVGPPDKAREHLKLLSEYPMCFAPGTSAMYANVNFVPLALMIENISGLPYAKYMRQEVFEPLGMHTAQDTLRVYISYQARNT